MNGCICAEPLPVTKGGKARIRPCPWHGFFGEKNPPPVASESGEETERG